ncbi:MAG TPA: hypothetical protein VMM76_28730 [Pirellulaceae bacterium]|nr:hypothetical protein [Pirellulaceae bacterium]
MPSELDKTKRRWRLQIRLSTALLLVTIIAIVCAWVVDHRRLRQLINRDADKVQILEYLVKAHENDAQAAKASLEVWEQRHKDHLFRRSIHDEVTGMPFDLSRAVPSQ